MDFAWLAEFSAAGDRVVNKGQVVATPNSHTNENTSKGSALLRKKQSMKRQAKNTLSQLDAIVMSK
jgi:hypothetical protein